MVIFVVVYEESICNYNDGCWFPRSYYARRAET